ncbi:hypothetical protein [Duganella violaceipulchra]|uniref:DoxX family protein n=1 Tax=Duganella violaceipulchra TaxID=2849652 RepID=A0AA41H9F6_9BURK|nr:hypothetical protein [Duganella violaceicalia]MBV6323160.1 hypothetical protein [Duganella violaceicalia]MCP2010054.1 hypothetical protein [Duganella violaceicalia]
MTTSRNEKLFVNIVRDPSFWIRLVYVICLTGATYNHASIVAAHGLNWDYGGLPVFVCVFWTALTFIDALAVILLITKPLVGLSLAAAIIVCDVIINSWVGATYGFDIPSFLAQALFLIFVMSTIRIAWRAESGKSILQR